MSKIRRNHAPAFKAKVALEAIKGEKTLHEIAARYQVHPTQVSEWRKQLIEGAGGVFSGKRPEQDPKEREALLAKIGQLTMERDFLERVLNR